MEKCILIMAGGDGSRLNPDAPKQFIELNGLPLLMHTFHAFLFLDATYVLVIGVKWVTTWKSLCEKHNFQIPHKIETGGPKRFHSVKSGLKSVPDNVLVAIHDGVRPLVDKETISTAFGMAERKGNAVPAITITESVRQTDGVLNHPIAREGLRIVQTPQVFHSTEIKKAYKQNFHEHFTDDATVFENEGHQINLTKGNPENIKITHSTDLLIAEKLLEARGK